MCSHERTPFARLKDLQEQGRLLVAGPMPAIDSDNPGEAGIYWLNSYC